jgi:SAM-dependent methyltransferase
MGRVEFGETAADLAAVAGILEIAENLGISHLLDRAAPFTLDEVTDSAKVSEPAATTFLQAMIAADLVVPGADPRRFTPCADLADRRYAAGYLTWALDANRPYLDNAAAFLRDPESAGATYQRDGRRVAVSSRWIGSFGFYPGIISEIIGRKPSHVVDLGAGAGGLLIQLLAALPESHGLALDLSAAACEEAGLAAGRAGVGDRFQVVNRSIESLIEDPSPVHGANVVHAGFVMHDVVSRHDVFTDLLRTLRASLAEGGCLVVTDAVPYVPDRRERSFSALFTYLHASSMGVQLPTEDEWQDAFLRAGFADVKSTPLRMPGSRMFVAVG